MALVQPLTPTLYTVVASLPRGARLEKEVVVHSGLFVAVDPNFADSNGDEIERTPTFSQGDVHIVTQCDTTSQWQVTENVMPTDRDTRLELHWEVSHFLPSTEACAVLFVRGHSTGAGDPIKRLKAASALSPFLTRTLSAKVFVSPEIGEPEQCTFFQSFP